MGRKQHVYGNVGRISHGPSRVIGGAQFDTDHQFSPNWLSGTEGVR
jgi:hypothetical protein